VNLLEVYCKKRKKSKNFFLFTKNGGVRRSGYTYRGGYTYRAGCIYVQMTLTCPLLLSGTCTVLEMLLFFQNDILRLAVSRRTAGNIIIPCWLAESNPQ
jgi:hypothetical protein